MDYLRFEKRLSPHTLRAYETDLSQFFSFLTVTYDIKAFQEVKHLHVRAWIVELVQQQVANRSINRKISALKSLYRYLKKHQLVDVNPIAKVNAPKIGKRLPAVVQKKELEQLFSALVQAEGFSLVRDYTILALLYHTGIRRSELMQICLGDIDFHGCTIRVMGKGAKERLIPFSGHLAKILRKYIDLRKETFDNAVIGTIPEVLLTDKGKPLYPKYIYNKVKQYLSIVTTLEQRSPHVLRHSFATHLSDNGAPLNAIKALLGHSSLAATQIYTHNSIDRLRAIYQKAHPKAED